jgi:hypothetical protein
MRAAACRDDFSVPVVILLGPGRRELLRRHEWRRQHPGTLQQPWLTIQHAANVATPGSTVYVRTGTYEERVKAVANKPLNRITLYPDGTERFF